MEKENTILNLLIQFAIDIIAFSERLEAERKVDFIHKLKIAAKEMEETAYWLILCQHAPSYPYEEKLANDLLGMKRICSKIIFFRQEKQLAY